MAGRQVGHLDVVVIIIIALYRILETGGARCRLAAATASAASTEVAVPATRPVSGSGLLVAPLDGLALLAPVVELLLVARLELLLLLLGQVLPAPGQLLLQAELAGGDLVLVLGLQHGAHVFAVDLEGVARSLRRFRDSVACGAAAPAVVVLLGVHLGMGEGVGTRGQGIDVLADEGRVGVAAFARRQQRRLPVRTLSSQRFVLGLHTSLALYSPLRQFARGINASIQKTYSGGRAGAALGVFYIGTGTS